MEIKGLKEFQQKLDDLAKKAEAMDGKHEVPIGDVLTPEFIAKNTRFKSIEDLFQAGGFKVESSSDLEAIPEAELDGFIAKETAFQSWKDMLNIAVQEWGKRQLGL